MAPPRDTTRPASDGGPEYEPHSGQPEHAGHSEPNTTGRRRFLGYLLAAPTLAAAAPLSGTILGENNGPLRPATANGATVGGIASNPQLADVYDLEDLLTDGARPTANLITVTLDKDGVAHFAVPRCEVGQGIFTAMGMVIAEEMDLPLEKVKVASADARPELMYNQLTGGSNTVNSMYTPVRVAAAIAKGNLLAAAAAVTGDATSTLTSRLGVISAPGGQSLNYGELAEKAASQQTRPVEVQLKPESEFKIVGKPTRRTDALDIVTGRKVFTTDLMIPDALPTMVARADTINGTPKTAPNIEAVRRMPGVTDVAQISTGWAVRAKTFSQCMDAVRALDVSWNPSTVAGESDEKALNELKQAALPALVPGIPGAKVVEGEYGFAFATGAPMEPGCAVADIKKDHGEIWASLKIPITAQGEIAQMLGMPQQKLKVHVLPGGGSFGRRLFHDYASDAAEASRAMGKPVKLMWHRTDECRQGRVHPMSFSRLRANIVNGQVANFEQHHASVRTDFSHGLGELISATATRLPAAGLGVSETIFETTAVVPYNYGPTKQLLAETHQNPDDNQYYGGFKTTSMRNVYSPNVVTAQELFTDKLAQELGKDPVQFRLETAKDEKFHTVIQKAAQVGKWGRTLPAGMAQGFGVHREYKNTIAALVEIDCRPETVNRPAPGRATAPAPKETVTGPRVTKVVLVTIPGGLVINPLGFEAQMQGGSLDAIALALTSSLHLQNGHYLEGSWDNYYYTRQWNVPADMEMVILPADKNDKPAGAGEMAVAPVMAAVANAYSRAVGTQPDFWPVNHGKLQFEPKPFKPTIPESPTNGLDYAY